MTWAEFQIRSFGFKRVRKWQMFLTREIAYEVHCNRYLWGKRTPPKKERFWPLDGKKPKLASEASIEQLKKEWEEYNKKKNGKA